MKLNDEQFAVLTERIKKGKEILAKRNWDITNPKTRAWFNAWKALTDIHLEEISRRFSFAQKETISKDRIAGESPDEYVDRIKAKLIQERIFTGTWTKPWLKKYLQKKGGTITNDTPRINSHPLFTTR